MTHAEAVIAALSDGPKGSAEIADACRLTRAVVTHALDYLKARGVVERVDSQGLGFAATYGLVAGYATPAPDTAWTDERVALLKQLWAAGDSAAGIARQLDCGLSRSAVLGKVNRLGLGGRREAARPSGTRGMTPGTRRAPPPPVPTRPPRAPKAAQVKQQPKPPPQVAPPIDVAPVRLLGLGPNHCRWPVSDPGLARMAETLFCGAPRGTDTYCARHARIAYQPTRAGHDAAKPTFDRRRYNGRNANGLSRSTVFWE